MTWAITAHGTKADALEQVAGHELGNGAADQRQFDEAKVHILAAIERADDKALVKVAASGHEDHLFSSESIKIEVTPPVAEVSKNPP